MWWCKRKKGLILLQEITALVSACSDYLVLIHSACNNNKFLCVVMMSPEVATSPPLRSLFENNQFKRNLVLIAVDEAHCICEWLVTQSFYHSLLWVQFIFHRDQASETLSKKLGTWRSFTKAPFMAPSVSAPPAFERTIFSSLALSDPVFHFDICTKITLFVCYLQIDFSGVPQALKEYTNSSRMPKTIIFCHMKHAVSNVYRFLSKSAKSRAYVSTYYASLKLETKNYLHGSFTSTTSQLSCPVATIAFGLVWHCMMNHLAMASCCLFTVHYFYRELILQLSGT